MRKGRVSEENCLNVERCRIRNREIGKLQENSAKITEWKFRIDRKNNRKIKAGVTSDKSRSYKRPLGITAYITSENLNINEISAAVVR